MPFFFLQEMRRIAAVIAASVLAGKLDEDRQYFDLVEKIDHYIEYGERQPS